MNFPFPERDVEFEIERRAQEAEYYGAMLKTLADVGLMLAQAIGSEVRNQIQANAADRYGPSDKTPAADATAAFERVSRSVRMSIMLARALGLPDPVAAPRESRATARARIVRAVEDTIGRSAPVCERESLRCELMERMERPELAEDVSGRPVAEVIEEICRDLGIASPLGAEPWVRRTPADVVALREWASRNDAGWPRAGSAARGAGVEADTDPSGVVRQVDDWSKDVRDG